MTDWNPDNHADLGIWEDLSWTPPEPPPPAKKKKLSLSLKTKGREPAVSDRFNSPEKSLETYQQRFIPKKRESEEQQAEACNVLAKCVPAGKENVTPHVTQQSMQMISFLLSLPATPTTWSVFCWCCDD